MSEIKLPVSIAPSANFHRLWKVHDADNFMLCRDLSESQAKAIATALNLHDELVEALTARMKEVSRHAIICACPHCELLEKAKL